MGILSQLKSELSLKHLKQDLPASLAVFLVALPLCLGIAHASGAPPVAGLITGIVAGIVVGLLSQSALSVSGPAAGLTAIVAAAAMELKSFEALLVAVFLAGLMQIAFGYFKMGAIAAYIPNAVIKGMLAAIGIILILKQVPHLMGYDAEDEGLTGFQAHGAEEAAGAASHGIGNTFTLLWDSVQNFTPHILAIGLISIAVILIWDRTLGKKIKVMPSSLIAVVVGTLLAVAYGFYSETLTLAGSHLVQVPQFSSLSSFLEQNTTPNWATLFNPRVYMIALTIALVASIETLLSIEAIDKMDLNKRLATPGNRELMAQGVGNTISGLVGGIPMTSVIIRSSVNMVAGAMTKLSAIFHGMWLLIAVAFAAPLLNLIPLSALAAVLIVIGYKLASPKLIKSMYKNGWDQFIPYIVTILAIVLTDLLIGVLVGIAVAAAFIIYSHYKSDVIEIQKIGDVKKLIFAENLTFLNKGRILDTLDSFGEGDKVILDTTHTKYIDHDVMDVIEEFKNSCESRQIMWTVENKPEGKEPINLQHAERFDTIVNIDKISKKTVPL